MNETFQQLSHLRAYCFAVGDGNLMISCCGQLKSRTATSRSFHSRHADIWIDTDIAMTRRPLEGGLCLDQGGTPEIDLHAAKFEAHSDFCTHQATSAFKAPGWTHLELAHCAWIPWAEDLQ